MIHHGLLRTVLGNPPNMNAAGNISEAATGGRRSTSGSAVIGGAPEPRARPRWRLLLGCLAAVVVATGLPVGAGAGAVAAAEGVCDRLEVPTVELERCVVAGHQSEIDAGQVVRVSELSSANVQWIAGHRTSHEGTFRSLPGLQLGDVVTFQGDRYGVVEYVNARYDDADGVAAWASRSTATLVLQTSKNAVSAHFWRAERLADTPSAGATPDQPQQRPGPSVSDPTPVADPPLSGQGGKRSPDRFDFVPRQTDAKMGHTV